MARSAGPITPAEETPRAAAVLRRSAVGVAAAVGVWFGWLNLAPAFGFPSVSPAGMFNHMLRADPDAQLGSVVLLAGPAALAVAYVVATAKGLFRPGLLSGALYGLAVWFLTGAILMPLMGLVSPDQPAAAETALTRMREMVAESASDRMRGTFMMLHLGLLAPVGALIAWVLFGGVLGATSSKLLRPAGAAK